MSEALRDLGRAAAEHLDAGGPQLDEAKGLARFREVVDAGAVPRRKRRVPLLVVLAAVAAMLALWLWPRKPLNFVLEGGQPAEVTAWIDGEAATAARFSDGSLVRGRAGSRWRVHATSARGATLQLERGALTADVTHRDDTDWQIDAGPFAVRVTGTSFTTVWDPVSQIFELAMHEGTVVLSGPIVGSRREVSAPEHLRIKVGDRQLSVVAPHDDEHAAAAPEPVAAAEPESATQDEPDAVEPDGAPADEPEPAAAAEPVASRLGDEPVATQDKRERAAAKDGTAAGEGTAAKDDTASGEPGASQQDAIAAWRAHATARRYPQALTAIREQGAAALLASATPADLLLIAQVARLGGDAALAGQALATLRSRHPQSLQARTAQFLEGRMQFDRGQHAAAVTTLSAYLAAAPGGAFAGEAQVLRILALHRAGRTDEARRRAKAYLQHNPTGPQAERIRSILTP